MTLVKASSEMALGDTLSEMAWVAAWVTLAMGSSGMASVTSATVLSETESATLETASSEMVSVTSATV